MPALSHPVLEQLARSVPVPRERMTWIRSYAEASEVLRSPDFVSQLHMRYSRPIIGDSVNALFGAEHSARRRMELGVVAHTKILEYEFGVLMPVIERGLRVDRAEGPLDLLELLKNAVLMVSASVLGLDGVAADSDLKALWSVVERIGNGAHVEWSMVAMDSILRAAMEARQEFLVRYFEPSQRRREKLVASWRAGEMEERELPTDLLTILLKANDSWDEVLLIREVLFWLSASTGTTVHGSAHAFREIVSWLDTYPEERPLFDNPSFLQTAVGEAMRLHPPLPGLIRVALIDMELTTGRQIKAREHVVLDMPAINKDRSFFGEDADVFNPHRTGPSAMHPYGISFGHGVHRCIGRRLAIGAGNGRVGVEGEPVGLIVRLMQLLLAHDVSLVPDNPPKLRDWSIQERWERFPIQLGRK